jgi:hypothetical protein
MIARTDLRTAKRPTRNDPPVAVYAEFTPLDSPSLADPGCWLPVYGQLNLPAVCKKQPD